jgi:hypothetical protein
MQVHRAYQMTARLGHLRDPGFAGKLGIAPLRTNRQRQRQIGAV